MDAVSCDPTKTDPWYRGSTIPDQAGPFSHADFSSDNTGFPDATKFWAMLTLGFQ